MTVNLDNNTLRKRAAAFAKDFSKSTYEMGEAQNFIRSLCHIFDLNHRRAVRFEERVKKLGGKHGRIDGFFPGLLLVEMKSTGADLDKAYIQATEYFPGLKDAEMPRCVLVSDFANLHPYNLESKELPLKIKLAEFPQAIAHFKFIAGYETIAVRQQAAINQRAAEKMAGLHDAIKATGYAAYPEQGRRDLETYLVRLLFCLFAEDTGLFDRKDIFLDYLINHTKADGSDLHGLLTSLFDTLNRDRENRPNNLPEQLAEFPHINGALFKDNLAALLFRFQANPSIPVAFVSTNSLTQGEQVAILWTKLLKLNIKLHFAHRTFRWSNEGKGIAAVHCVIMGFICGRDAKSCVSTVCRLFDYGDDITGEPIEIQAKQLTRI
jgi:hypothetical protein